jgi:hypothetical protein
MSEREGRVSEDFDEREHLVETHIGETSPALAGVGGTTQINPSELPLPYMSEEEQSMEMTPQVVGPPSYASPDPATSAGRLLPVKDHPLESEQLEISEAQVQESSVISEDYGQDVKGITLPAPVEGGTQTAPLTPEQSGGVAPSPEAGEAGGYEAKTKNELLGLADERGLDVSSTMTKTEIIDALKADDEQTA